MNQFLRRYLTLFSVLFVLLSAHISSAEIRSYRWTNQYGMTDDLHEVLTALNRESGLNLTYADFNQFERRDLKNYRFTTYRQLHTGVPIQGALIRTWVNLQSGYLVQMEATLDDGKANKFRSVLLQKNNLMGGKLKSFLNKMDDRAYALSAVAKNLDDRQIVKIESTDYWSGPSLERHITVTGKHGLTRVVVSHTSGKVLSSTYEQFPQADLEVDAMVYPIYEEPEFVKKIQTRVPVKLKNVVEYRRISETDPYAPLRNRRYLESMIDPVQAETEEGQLAGYWSFQWLINAGKALLSTIPLQANSFENGGVYLEGKHVSISYHPDVVNVKGVLVPLRYSGKLNYIWKATQDNGTEVYEVVPMGTLASQPLVTPQSASERVARRLPNHDVASYINDGFDEVQVYYAVDRLMTSLQGMGFTDPELSARPFHAFLYDPDISMRDNAYYQNDTINFTTYSPENQNYARDNSTIWHELGHGVMDRLMGDLITLADSGGLSEGMADFVAQLVVQDVTGGETFDGSGDFRIMNNIGFSLTNESHDDGEAYGGAMKDIMDLSIAKFGRAGLVKMADLTLEAMRLARNHPALTANDWFEHMLFADELGSEVRGKGDLRDAILEALRSRNFRLDRGEVASFTVMVGDSELTQSSPGSRNRPYLHELKGKEQASYDLNLSLKNSSAFQFKYPVTIEANFNGSPLQGGVRWKGEKAGPVKFVLKSEADKADLKLSALPGCDFVNREDGSCSDYVHIKVFNAGENRPIAKKRFYVRVK